MCPEATNQYWHGDRVTYSSVPWDLRPQTFALWDTYSATSSYLCLYLVTEFGTWVRICHQQHYMWQDRAGRHKLRLNGCLHNQENTLTSCSAREAPSASTFSFTQVSSHRIKAKLHKSCMKWKGYNTFRSLLICMFLAIN